MTRDEGTATILLPVRRVDWWKSPMHSPTRLLPRSRLSGSNPLPYRRASAEKQSYRKLRPATERTCR